MGLLCIGALVACLARLWFPVKDMRDKGLIDEGAYAQKKRGFLDKI